MLPFQKHVAEVSWCIVQEPSEWIAVKKQLPFDGQRVIAKTEQMQTDMKYYRNVGFIPKVTHWKPDEEKSKRPWGYL